MTALSMGQGTTVVQRERTGSLGGGKKAWVIPPVCLALDQPRRVALLWPWPGCTARRDKAFFVCLRVALSRIPPPPKRNGETAGLPPSPLLCPPPSTLWSPPHTPTPLPPPLPPPLPSSSSLPVGGLCPSEGAMALQATSSWM